MWDGSEDKNLPPTGGLGDLPRQQGGIPPPRNAKASKRTRMNSRLASATTPIFWKEGLGVGIEPRTFRLKVLKLLDNKTGLLNKRPSKRPPQNHNHSAAMINSAI